MRIPSCYFIAVLVLFMGSFAYGATHKLFTRVPRPQLMTASDLTTDSFRISYAKVDIEYLRQGEPTVVLDLFSNVTITAEKTNIEWRSSSQFTWMGSVSGNSGDYAIFVVENGTLAGDILYKQKLYKVRLLGHDLYAIVDVDTTSFQDEAKPLRYHTNRTTPLPLQTKNDRLGKDDNVIDVMIVYTQEAANNSKDINVEIQLAIDETNMVFANSGIFPKVRLVYSGPVNYVETNMSNSLNQLKGGSIPSVHELRDRHKADLVSMWLEKGETCGMTWAPEDPYDLETFAERAFSVVMRKCATGYYSQGHEWAHNFGAAHDWYDDDWGGIYKYSHGYINKEAKWRTVMAVNAECQKNGFNCVRIPFFSNPDVLYNGMPVGVPMDQKYPSSNAATLNVNAAKVANFR